MTDSERVEKLEAVAEAARAEVLAQGYRSTDMATAMKALWGEWWFETYVPPDPPRCDWSYITEMDDGPLIQRCQLAPHGADVEHKMRPAYSVGGIDESR